MQLPFVIERPYGRVSVTLEVYDEGPARVCSVFDVRGRLHVKRRWYQLMRGHLHRIERIAKAAGCTEMRLAGRNWSRVLPDYQPMPGIANRLRKVLT